MIENVAIVGTGLIGASFGLALRASGFGGPIVGVSSPAAVAAATQAGAVDRAATLAEAVPAADLVFLAQPIGRIVDTIHHLDPLLKPGALVTDAGSTKGEIVDAALESIQPGAFIGGHPMAGKEKRGAAAADAELFRGSTWVLTPSEPGDLDRPIVHRFIHWLHAIGARPISMSAAEHDRVVALTSHLAQLASTALAATVSENVPAERLDVAGSGLADMSRLALSSYELWRDIVATNSASIDRALGAYIQKLEHIRENLRTRQLQEEFERGASLAAKVRGSSSREKLG